MTGKVRCEGWRRYGGAFTLGGTPQWVQCENEAVVTLTLIQAGEPESQQPSCMECWKEAQGYKGIVIRQAVPIESCGGHSENTN